MEHDKKLLDIRVITKQMNMYSMKAKGQLFAHNKKSKTIGILKNEPSYRKFIKIWKIRCLLRRIR